MPNGLVFILFVFSIQDPYSNADAADSGGAVKKEEFLAPFFGLNPVASEAPASLQWAATYPPRLPSLFHSLLTAINAPPTSTLNSGVC